MTDIPFDPSTATDTELQAVAYRLIVQAQALAQGLEVVERELERRRGQPTPSESEPPATTAER